MPHREGRLKEVHNQKTALSNSQTSIDAQLKTAKTSFVNLVHSESLKGDVKGAINAKITNHQVPLLTNFTNALAVLLA
ncbi:transposase, Gram-positive bacteria [Streptococcus cristatus]|nr:transposase, Gram-positive bacteria [Streptococcus cristatus]